MGEVLEMRRIFSSLTLVFASTLISSVVLAQTPGHFRGSACVISATAGCSAQGVGVGNCMAARFTPPNFGSSGNATRLSLFHNYYTQNASYFSGSLVGTVFRNVTMSQIGNGASTYPVTMRIPSQVPANPATAAALTVIADINAFQSGCNVRLRFQGQRIPVSGPLP